MPKPMPVPWMKVPEAKREQFIEEFIKHHKPGHVLERKETFEDDDHGDQIILLDGSTKFNILRIGKYGRIVPEGPFDLSPTRRVKGNGFHNDDVNELLKACEEVARKI